MNVSTSLPDFNALFPFKLDDFQQQAIAALEAGRSIVVCAPTGSGKTVIGEYAIYRALASGRRVFYTTPLKALSNQKLRDFRQCFGAERVGLLTGDISVNREAPILVMTTEIFRNMLYGTPIGEVGTSLTGVEVVVLDECHYMNDRQRGTVWEESIIYCPPEIQLVALSATVANGDQLTDWINRVHGPTELIYSDWRPVPLQFHFCNPRGLFPLLNRERQKINPRLQLRGGRNQRPRGDGRSESPSIAYTLSQLQQRDMLPAIYFIFSRRGCDQAVTEADHISLVTPQEAGQLKRQIDQFLAENPEAGRTGQIGPLYQGIAAHHAGMLPIWKGWIEQLFQQGLIKVVFATETLAAGINMPARTTVISSLSKRTDRGHRLLNPSEFLQMAGRAGRRGMDQRGHVVTLQTPFEGAREAAYLATSRADPLISQFTPSYGMVLNLLQTHTLEEAKNLVERSFGQYLATLHLAPQKQAIADLQTQLSEIQTKLAAVDLAALNSYQKLRERLKEEGRLLKILQQQAEEARASELAVIIPYAPPGTIVSLQVKHGAYASGGDTNRAGLEIALPAVLVTTLPSPGQFPYLACLGQDNRWYIVAVNQVVALHGELAAMTEMKNLAPPEAMPLKLGQSYKGTGATAAIAQALTRQFAKQFPDYQLQLAPEVFAQLKRVEAVEAQLKNHPAHQWPNHAALLKLQRQASYLEEQINDRQAKLDVHSQRHWEEFLCLIKILQSFGGLNGLNATPLGQAAAALRGDNELWLGLALMSGELDHLDPHHLAAACTALVTEVSRSDSWTRYVLSPQVKTALSNLRALRRQLFQLQRRQDVVLPVWLEVELVGLVEQWALGTEWVDLCANTSLDEGDVVRMLRRTLDFLSQVPYTPHISEELRQNAARAKQLIDRFPVNEVL